MIQEGLISGQYHKLFELFGEESDWETVGLEALNERVYGVRNSMEKYREGDLRVIRGLVIR